MRKGQKKDKRKYSEVWEGFLKEWKKTDKPMPSVTFHKRSQIVDCIKRREVHDCTKCIRCDKCWDELGNFLFDFDEWERIREKIYEKLFKNQRNN